MLTPGSFGLGSFTGATASGEEDGGWIIGLEGMLALTLQLRFAYGSGGAALGLKAYLQTSFDKGDTAVDIACITFSQANKNVGFNFSGLTPKTTAETLTDRALADDTAVDGPLGDRIRLVVKAGAAAYGGSSLLTGWINAR
jgi:hypothetical protein